jgi:hypothetical protein
MRLLLDSFWRAAAYCLHPRVIALSVLPLVLMAALSFGLYYFFWETAVASVRAAVESVPFVMTMVGWLEGIGLGGLKGALAPLVIVALSAPVIVVLSLLLVAGLMTPSLVSLVTDRRFPKLEKKHGGSFFGSMFGALWATVAALVALVVSIPLWFIPPLVLILPPLIWGWLTYRVMAYDVLAEHASRVERAEIMRRHRPTLLALGVVTGYLGAAPSLVWAWGALSLVLAPVLVPVAVWIYTLVFAFSALWFAHYALAALEGMRAEVEVVPPAARTPLEPTELLVKPTATSSTHPYEPVPIPPP